MHATADRGPVLITGGQGFVGGWLAERLVGAGVPVVVPVRAKDPGARFWTARVGQRCTVVSLDLCDPGAVARLLDDHAIRTVFHLAAQSLVGVAQQSPYTTWETNVRGTYTLLDACAARIAPAGTVERVVVASSEHVYGSTQESL